MILLFLTYKRWKHWSDDKRRNIENKLKMSILSDLYYIIQRAGDISDTKPFMIYGTLLGKIRLDNILCHDFDVDYGIIDNEFEKFYEKLKHIVNESYKIKKINVLNFRFIHIIHKPTGLSADISGFSIKANSKIKRNVLHLYSKYVLHENKSKYPIEWILPLKQTLF